MPGCTTEPRPALLRISGRKGWNDSINGQYVPTGLLNGQPLFRKGPLFLKFNDVGEWMVSRSCDGRPEGLALFRTPVGRTTEGLAHLISGAGRWLVSVPDEGPSGDAGAHRTKFLADPAVRMEVLHGRKRSRSPSGGGPSDGAGLPPTDSSNTAPRSSQTVAEEGIRAGLQGAGRSLNHAADHDHEKTTSTVPPPKPRRPPARPVWSGSKTSLERALLGFFRSYEYRPDVEKNHLKKNPLRLRSQEPPPPGVVLVRISDAEGISTICERGVVFLESVVLKCVLHWIGAVGVHKLPADVDLVDFDFQDVELGFRSIRFADFVNDRAGAARRGQGWCAEGTVPRKAGGEGVGVMSRAEREAILRMLEGQFRRTLGRDFVQWWGMFLRNSSGGPVEK